MRTSIPRLIGALALVGGGLTTSMASPASAGPDPEFQAEVVRAFEYETGFGSLPECGPRNINGRGNSATPNSATWRVSSTLAPGSVVDVGDEWVVRGSVVGVTANNGNNGPDPLNLRLPLQGPIAPVGPVVGETDFGPGEVLHGGDGFTGPVGQLGNFGFEFDQNSNPGVFESGDGAMVRITITVRATAPGVVSLDHMDVFGYDETPTASDFDCDFEVGWTWTVDDPDDPPTSGLDQAATDSRYPLEAFDDANGGSHSIDIDVLSNDNDPEVAGGPGDTDEVRIHDWQPLSVEGAPVSCGTDAQKGNATFSQMSTGTCSYAPPVGFEGTDRFGYVLRSVTGLERFVWVNIDVNPNHAPVVGEPEFVITDGDTIVNGPLGALVADPDDDPVSCSMVTGPDAGQGTAAVDADCGTFDYDPEGFTGDTSFTFRACDTHATLTDGDMGIATRADGYELGDPDDLSAAASRRCVDRTAAITVVDDNQVLLIPPIAGTDVDVVDAGYDADAVGDYRVRIPVLDNDYDPNDPEFPAVIGEVIVMSETLDPALGTASFDGQELVFEPADGVDGQVNFKYRICDDGPSQNPPQVDNPDTPFVDESQGTCSFGAVSIFVVPNDAPIAQDDEVLTSSIADVVDLDAAVNDSDPQGETIECTPGPLAAEPEGLVAAASIDAQCLVDITPVIGAEGVATLAYEVCDVHALSHPANPETPYGTDGLAPGDVNHRCSTAAVLATIVAPAGDDPDLFDLDPGPACAADAITTAADTPVDVAVLTNDTDVDFAQQPSALTVGSAGFGDQEDLSEHGAAVAPTADGTQVAYTPAAGFSGVDTFIYSAQDLVGKGCSAEVTVTVTPGAGGGPGVGFGGGGTGTGAGGGGGGGSLARTGGSLAQVPLGIALTLAGGAILALGEALRRRQA